MPKTNYGRYGGTNIGHKTHSSFWITQCCICKHTGVVPIGKALYRFGNAGFCKNHKGIAAEWRYKYVVRLDKASSVVEAKLNDIDASVKKHERAAKTARFSKRGKR